LTLSDSQTLDEVCEFIVDCLHKTAPVQEVGYPSIRTPNVGRGRLILDGVNRVSDDVYAEWTRRAVPMPGDLILAREAPAGNVAVIKDGQTVCLGQRTVHLRPDRRKVDPDFLCYYLLAPKQQGGLLAGETGATAGHVNMRDIRRLNLGILPELSTQKKAGQILATYDDLMENNRQRITLLEQAARMLYREWFVHFRFPGHEHIEVIDGIPEGWEGLSASAAFEINPSTPRNGDGDILYVPMAALRERGMTVDPRLLELRANSTNVRFRNGDTLFARITPCLENGKTGFVNFLQDNEVACGSTEFIVLRGRRVSPYFVYLTARQDSFRENAIKSMIGSSGRQRVQDSCFDRYRVAIPPPIIASVFDEMVAMIFEQIGKLDQTNQKLSQARDLLLPRLMNGEVAV
jgi:type I restriction enzyme, S subunit